MFKYLVLWFRCWGHCLVRTFSLIEDHRMLFYKDYHNPVLRACTCGKKFSPDFPDAAMSPWLIRRGFTQESSPVEPSSYSTGDVILLDTLLSTDLDDTPDTDFFDSFDPTEL